MALQRAALTTWTPAPSDRRPWSRRPGLAQLGGLGCQEGGVGVPGSQARQLLTPSSLHLLMRTPHPQALPGPDQPLVQHLLWPMGPLAPHPRRPLPPVLTWGLHPRSAGLIFLIKENKKCRATIFYNSISVCNLNRRACVLRDLFPQTAFVLGLARGSLHSDQTGETWNICSWPSCPPI